MPKFNITIESADGTMRADVGDYEAADEAAAVADVIAQHAADAPVLISVSESLD